jgi:hypothetical protein
VGQDPALKVVAKLLLDKVRKGAPVLIVDEPLQIPSSKILSQETVNRLSVQKERLKTRYGKDSVDAIISLPDDGSLTLQSIFLPPEMFVPGSLGADADIPAELKEKIIHLQAPNAGAAALPAKYYHVLGAASSGCSLRQRGLSEPVIIAIQKRIAEIYRGRRVCQDVQDSVAFSQFAIKTFRSVKMTQDFPNFLTNQVERVMSKKSDCQANESTDPFCPLITRQFGGLSAFADLGQILTHDEILSRVHRLIRSTY